MKSLPLDLSNYPALLAQKDLDLLKGCSIIKKIDAQKEQIKKNYDVLCASNSDLNKAVSLEEFTRGTILASQRAYDLAYTDGSIRQVLIPYIDVSPINHGSPNNVKCFQRDGYLKLIATSPIERGQIVVQAQSKACNSSVFIKSGFIAENNEENNSVPIIAELDVQDPNFKMKLELINQAEIAQNFVLNQSFIVKSTCEFFSWCRYIVYDEDQAFLVLARTQAIQQANTKMAQQGMTPEEQEKYKDQIFKARDFQPISMKNEKAALKKVISICLGLLCKYPTTMKNDIKELESGKLSYS